MENTSRIPALPASHLPATAGTLPGFAHVAGNARRSVVSYGLAQFDLGPRSIIVFTLYTQTRQSEHVSCCGRLFKCHSLI